MCCEGNYLINTDDYSNEELEEIVLKALHSEEFLEQERIQAAQAVEALKDRSNK